MGEGPGDEECCPAPPAGPDPAELAGDLPGVDRRAVIRGSVVLVADPTLSADLHERGAFGWFHESSTLELSLPEALFLLDRGRIQVVDPAGLPVDREGFVGQASAQESDFLLRYCVYRDLRIRGYVVKSGLKYGTHFRVYERGVRPRRGNRSVQEHAKFLVHATSEAYQCSVPELTRLVRLAHSVKKRVWMGIVDSEGGVTYFQVLRVTP